jgi:hypothetical protein
MHSGAGRGRLFGAACPLILLLILSLAACGRESTAKVRRAPATPASAPTATARPAGPPAPAITPTPAPIPLRIQIPTIGVNAPLVPLSVGPARQLEAPPQWMVPP